MSSSPLGTRFIAAALAVLLLAATAAWGQSTAALTGTVMDESGAVIPNAQVTATNQGTNLQRTATTDSSGNYQIPFLPAGSYRIEVQASGLQHQTVTNVRLDVSRTVAQNFRLKPATVEQAVTITGEMPVIESTTMTVGQVMDPQNVQQIPLNGRHFVDLGVLAAGSVTPPANGFLTAPIRGQGSLAIDSAGQRETAGNFLVNGINLTDKANGQITFQPSISTLDEFKVDNQSYSASEGGNAGAIVNMATRSGTNNYHGEVFEFMRNNYFDARNFFNKDTAPQSQFIRHDFGANLGGPIVKNKLFFFGSYEGLRQRQGISLNQTVLSASQRAAALASPSTTVQKLVPLIPTANDASGTKFIGSASAPVLLDQWSGDVSYNMSEKNRLHFYYVLQRDIRTEPTDACTVPPGCATVPGYGDQRTARRQLLTFDENHVFNNTTVNDFRLGLNRIHITFGALNSLDPSSFGINNGYSGAHGLPEFLITSTGLDFGGVSGFPQGRGDLTSIISDTLSWMHGRHNFKFGWEGGQVNDNNFNHDQTRVFFATPTDFINGNANSYRNLGDTGNKFIQRRLAFFAMDSFKVKTYLTLELGLRYEWPMTPFEVKDHMSAFNPTTGQLVQVGSSGLPLMYKQDNHKFGPRVGFSWDLFHDGKTVLRSGYGIAVAQTPIITTLNSNPPFVTTFNFTPSASKPFTSFSTLNADAAAAGASLNGTVDPNFTDGYVQSYNLNLQQEISPSMGLMIGYFGSKGTHLRSLVNLNQPFYTNPAVSAAQSKPFTAISSSSPIDPGLALGSLLNEWVSNGNSNYNALWATFTRRFSHGLQFVANYQWSKSLDYASTDTFQSGDRPSNSLNVRQDYGPSDFDARHRFTFSGVYDLPFKGNRLVQGWRLSGILTQQSGNPLNILAGNPAAGVGVSSFTGLATIRPDVSGPIPVSNQLITSGANAGLIQWIAPGIVCDPRGVCPAGSIITLPVSLVGGQNVYHFGNLSRNAVIGPNFRNVDMSLTKTTKITERLSNEFRLETFDLFNHPNFGNPSVRGAVTSANFGVISSTRFPNGDSGSARQLQFAVKFIF